MVKDTNIELAGKQNCTSCGNCLISCPKKAISFQKDIYDNIYPCIDSSLCIKCGLCQKSCPALNNIKKNDILECYAGYINNPKERSTSASGGIATAISSYSVKNKISHNGVFFDVTKGVAQHEICTDNIYDKYKNSKYIFSYMNDICIKIYNRIRAGEQFIFIGLPCQCAAVSQYINSKDCSLDNLILVDIICHGVSSEDYIIEHIKSKAGNKIIKEVFFRDPEYQTSKFVFSITTSNSKYSKFVESDDNFQIGYHNATFYRPNCYNCAYACRNRVGDISISDFTGIGKIKKLKNANNLKYNGISCILINTTKGKRLINELAQNKYITILSRPIEEAILYEGQLKNPSIPPKKYREKFLQLYPQLKFNKTCNIVFRYEKTKRPIIHFIKKVIKKLIGKK